MIEQLKKKAKKTTNKELKKAIAEKVKVIEKNKTVKK